MKELKDAYVMKLGKVLSMENTIIKHLPEMVRMASNEDLKQGLADHLEETQEQHGRLKAIVAACGGSTTERDEAFELMLENAGKELAKIDDLNVRDAVIIASAQTVEHIEIARYGTLIAWAKELDEDTDTIDMLKTSLAEEKAADELLTSVAEGGIFTEGVNDLAAEDK